MKAPLLQYEPKPVAPATSDSRRFALMGPLTGVWVGLAEACAAAACWSWHGNPSRGWDSIGASIGLSIGGVIVGCFYGLGLHTLQYIIRREIRLPVAIPATIIAAFIIQFLVTDYEFRQHVRDIDIFLDAPFLAVVCGAVIAAVTSRRAAPP